MSARHGEATGRSVALGRRIGLLALLGSLGAAAMAGCSSSAPSSQGSRVTHPTLVGYDGGLPLTGGPQLSCGQATQQARRQLAFPPTARMTVGETTTVEVELAASGAELVAGTGTTTTVVVRTTCLVKATLRGGPQLSILPQDEPVQDFNEGPVRDWTWLVTPNQGGSFPMRLDIESDAGGTPQTLDHRSVEIDAVVAPESVSKHVTDAVTSPLGLTVLGALLAVAFGLLGNLVNSRRKRRSTESGA